MTGVQTCALPISQRVDWNIVHGRPVVQGGELLTVDVPHLIERHNQAARRLLSGV